MPRDVDSSFLLEVHVPLENRSSNAMEKGPLSISWPCAVIGWHKVSVGKICVDFCRNGSFIDHKMG